ncbi:mucosal addressin cell adhesion molecule 1-like isoform 2-T2 [Anomaloglossus baeobatrachus]|uniref:mucosal addressin cell adhesion molecule 1-like isoform X2 n=1 Tax=Anomaloglossus baeobatrachus TaxID=238106 RepID=UPI003F505EFA
MALCLLCCIVLQLLLLSNAQHYLTVLPVDPVVSIGESIQLNCSINCPLGTVAWKGLDIFINKQYIANGYSVQTLENISMSMEGTKYCEGTCPGYRKAYQKSLQLHVYALPNTLLLSSNMKNGVHYLNCSMELVYPPPEVRCYKGYKMLNEGTDHEALHGDLYNVTWSWVVPEEDWLSDTSYRCEAQVHVNGQVFTREGSLNIFKGKTTTAIPASSPSQITSNLSQKLEAPYLTTTITNSQNPEITQRMPKCSTIISHQTTITGKHTKTASISSVTTQSAQPTTSGLTESNNIDGYYLMWSIVPATGLIGSILLSLHIYRQLSKKGFFQLNHTEFPTVKKGSKSQGGLQAVFCYDISAKKDFSMY